MIKKVDKRKLFLIISLLVGAFLLMEEPFMQKNATPTYCAVTKYGDGQSNTDLNNNSNNSKAADCQGSYVRVLLMVCGMVVGSFLFHCFVTWVIVKILLKEKEYKQLSPKRFFKAVVVEFCLFSFAAFVGKMKERRDRIERNNDSREFIRKVQEKVARLAENDECHLTLGSAISGD